MYAITEKEHENCMFQHIFRHYAWLTFIDLHENKHEQINRSDSRICMRTNMYKEIDHVAQFA